MTASEAVVLRGEARRPGGEASPATVTLGADGFNVAVGSAAPWSAAYRDVSLVAVDAGGVLVGVGPADGPGGERWLFERFGDRLGTLARGLRDGRLRQVASDGLVELEPDAPVDLVEYAVGDESGVAQLLYHGRGVVLAPLDERRRRRWIRRADIGPVELRPEVGGVRVEGTPGHPLDTGVDGEGATTVELLRLGQTAQAHRDRWAALRDGAATDAAAIVARLVPDAPFAVRKTGAAAMLEGRPVTPADLGEGWGPIEAATLAEPAFAESYRALRERGGGAGAERWLAVAPQRPGVVDEPRLWFLVGLPGNLVALELVSGGAHATYLFRVVPRATFSGSVPVGALARAVTELSDALVDARFLREPMALPAARLAEPAYLRYRLALAALPSLAAARRRFVGRVVHRDPESWAGAIDDLIRWHAASRDDDEEWPGRRAQDAGIEDAGIEESAAAGG